MKSGKRLSGWNIVLDYKELANEFFSYSMGD